MPETLLAVRNLKKYFPVRTGWLQPAEYVRAVDDVSFTIRRGETLGLVGESGSGKTTVGRTILRAIAPTAGEIVITLSGEDSIDLAPLTRRDIRPLRQHMQMIFQDPYASLSPRMTVRDIIAEPLVAGKLASGDEIDRRVRDIAERCRLNVEHLRRFPHAFSGGQRQRIGIARALISNPSFVVCDEPVSALDVSIQAEILNLLEDLQQERGLTYLFIAHDLSVVEHISDRVAVMYLGQIVELAPTQQIFAVPHHPYTEALLSSVPEPDPHIEMQPIPLKGEIPNPVKPPSGCYFHPRCPYVQDKCRAEPPLLREYQPGHFAACHFADELQLVGRYTPPEAAADSPH
ncbi:MAG: ABC transporter ATP-binding protein [Chloroflexi bacterium]|nr:ABC transporter ATP-binding protein [Chloroflexota bacterium]